MFWKSRHVGEIICEFETECFIQWDKEEAEKSVIERR